MVGVRVYPGTPIYREAIAENIVHPDSDFLQPTFYYSPTFDEGCMSLLLKQARARKNWVIPDAHVNTNLEFFRQLRLRQMKGPLWRVLRATQIGVAEQSDAP